MNGLSEISQFIKSLIGFLPLLITLLAAYFALKQIRVNAYINSRIRRLEKLEEVISDYVAELSNGISNFKNYRDFKNSGKGIYEDESEFYLTYCKASITINKLSCLTFLSIEGLDIKCSVTDHMKEVNDLFNNLESIGNNLPRLEELNNLILNDSINVISSSFNSLKAK